MRKQSIWHIVVAVGISSMMLVGCNLVDKKDQASLQQAQIDHEEQVIEIDGKIITQNNQTIGINFPAIIKNVHVKEGQKVNQEEPLITLDLRSYRNQITLKENELEIAKIRLGELKQTTNPQIATLAQMRNTLTLQKKKLHNESDEEIQRLENSLSLAREEEQVADKECEAAKQLIGIGAISQKEVQTLEQILISKTKTTENILLQISQLKETKNREIDELEAQIKSQQSLLSNSDASKESQIAMGMKEVQSLEIMIQDMKDRLNTEFIKGDQIVSPADDLVVAVLGVQQGMETTQLVGSVLELTDMKNLSIEIEIPEEYIADVRIGQTVKVSPIGKSDEVLQGRINTLAYQVEESFGENVIKAEVIVDGGLKDLRLGQSIEAQIIIGIAK